ncbi:hypothetical protein BH11MYX1_BH11MYX1_51510 [soil metagenome]
MMLSNTGLLITAMLAFGCNIDDGTKNACNVQTDCLTGFMCVNSTCVGSNNNVSPDAPSGPFYGTVEPIAAQTEGVAAANYQTLVAATTTPGAFGCAVTSDLQSSPGPDAAVAYAKVHAESGDTRCPNGVFAIINDPSACASMIPGELRPGCAIYKRWDASGQQVANQLATGGYVSITQTYLNDMAYRCDAELSVRFAGNVTIEKTFTFAYNPLSPAESFCSH